MRLRFLNNNYSQSMCNGSFVVWIVLGTFFLGNSLASQQKGSDQVPRNRFLSTSELFAQLDPNFPLLAELEKAVGLRDTAAAIRLLTNYFRTRTAPRYFFQISDIPERFSEFQQRYPVELKKIKRQADEYIRTYGSDVDWKLPGKDLLGRAHTPNTVRFLARQWQAENIALTYYLQRDDARYLQYLRAHIQDFVADYESGNAEAGANDVFERFYGGHRLRNWLVVHHLLLASDKYTADDHLLMLKVFLLHGARLMDVSEKFNWGNHQLVGLVALYEVSLLYPEFPVMREWNRKALKTILEHVEKEIPPDGFQVERASHYFKLDVMNYFRIYQLSKLNTVQLPQLFEERFQKMFDAMLAVAMPNRQMPVLQDAQSRTQSTSNEIAELSEPTEEEYFSIGAALFRNTEYKYFSAVQMPSSLFWFFEKNSIDEFEKLGRSIPKVGSLELPQTRYFVMRSGWQKDDLYAIIDAGLAKDKPDHTHGGILGLIAYGFGIELLPNYHVRYSDSSYKILKNSLVKNVALVDDLLQGRDWIDNKARTGFGRWKTLPIPQVHQWLSGSSFDYLKASHNAYEDHGVHYTRSVYFLKPICWVVVDNFSSTATHRYKQIWQGVYDTNEKKGEAIQKKGNVQLRILQADHQALRLTKQSVASTQSIQFESAPQQGYSFSTLLYPGRTNDHIIPSITKREGEYSEIEITLGERRWQILEGKGKEIRAGQIQLVGKMVISQSVGDTLVTLVCGEMTELRYNGIFVTCQRPASMEFSLVNGELESLTLLKGEIAQCTFRTQSGKEKILPLILGKSIPF
ncbi:MAG: heparinase II/III family protein [bacterium]